MVEKIKDVIKECKSVSDILKKINIINNGFNNDKVKKIIADNNLDSSHFNVKNKYKKVKKECPKCNNEFETMNDGKNSKKYCSRSCSNSRPMSIETKNKISLKNEKISKKDFNLFCINCNTKYYRRPSKIKKSKFCSKSCSTTYKNKKGLGRIAGLKSVEKQSSERRSKNEILFAEKCGKLFDNVSTNKPIFNGWDADIIIENYKLAILWNGKWHYEKITKSHSVEQVKNRDNIKIEEIKKCGYKPYIIKDMGKYSIKKVEHEFNILLNYLKTL